MGLDATIRLSNDSEERSRLLRLANVLSTVNRNSDQSVIANLIAVQDHEGELTVTWKAEPTVEGQRAFGFAWELENEAHENIRHEVA